MNWAIAAKAMRPIEASELAGETCSAQASASAMIAGIVAWRTRSMRRPISPDRAVAWPRTSVGKIRSFDTIVASAVESTMAIDAAALTPPSSAAASTKPLSAPCGSCST